MQASEKLYRQPVLVLRGSFNPVTLVHTDMLTAAAAEFRTRLKQPDQPWIELMEFSMNNLFAARREVTHAEFLARADILQKLGKSVLISKFGAFHRLGTYLSRYTKEPVGLVLSVDVLEKLFQEKWYEDLPGRHPGELRAALQTRPAALCLSDPGPRAGAPADRAEGQFRTISTASSNTCCKMSAS